MGSISHTISKSSFLKFEQCHKAFFLYKTHPYLRDKISVDKQLTFKRGHDVGYFAQKLFPGGRDVSKETKNSAEAQELTSQLIQSGEKIVYEATFQYSGVLIMADILVFENGVYNAYEVKSSMKVSEIYLKDAYLQYYVLKNSLPSFSDLFLVTINPDYVMQGEVEPKQLFRKRSVKEKAEENLAYFEYQINVALRILEQGAIPNIAVGKHCFKPYQCDFFGTCWKGSLEEDSIFNLPLIDRGRLFEWHSSGLKKIEQLEDAILEKESHIKIRDSILKQEPVIDKRRIAEILSNIKLPVATMDMEVWNPAIPQLQGTKPFEQIPFLVSFFDGAHYSWYFSAHENDDRKGFAIALLELAEKYASIVVYDKTLEVNVINNFINRFPELRGSLEKLKNKLVDLFEIFLGLLYYHPAFRNNFSLKAVSSVLVSDINYEGIASGLEAMGYYEQYRLNENLPEKEKMQNELITYCNTDCLATYRVLEFLQNLIK
jgi:predicted RecB family nuclease